MYLSTTEKQHYGALRRHKYGTVSGSLLNSEINRQTIKHGGGPGISALSATIKQNSHDGVASRIRHSGFSGNITVFARLIPLIIVFMIMLLQDHVTAQGTTSLRNLISSIEDQTEYRFLFRDALVAGKYGDRHAAPADPVANLQHQLKSHQIAMRVDTLRRQIILYEIKDGRSVGGKIVLRGQVIDARSGGRLPYATISWYEGGRLRGAAANEAGYFQISPVQEMPGSLILNASYLGYESATIDLDPMHLPGEISLRLQPSGYYSSEVIITGTQSASANDTLWRSAAQWGGMPAVGDVSTIRYLTPLPSVSVTGALSDGLIVRGSKSDGFQVLLDGIQIFNQNHFFGLFDAFNADALQTVGFYYDITPANLAGTPGGTLSVLTRTGSQHQLQAQAALTNSTIKGSADGPLASGRGSWLIAGRSSLMDNMNWFNGTDLIAWGLNVDRKTSVLPPQYDNPEARVLFPGSTKAMFYDLHGKFYYEWSGGKRLTLNAYTGGDNTRAGAERLVRNPDAILPRDRFNMIDVQTRNRWGNQAATLHFQTPAANRLYLHNMAGFSRYYASFSKDDFTYQRGIQSVNGQRVFIGEFENENALTEIKASQYADILTAGAGAITTGYALHYWHLNYEEDSAFQAAYTNESESILLDFFLQHDWKDKSWLHTWSGIRTHYYSNGDYFYLSPRFQFRLFPEHMVSIGGGYSRNYQFLHKLTLQNIQTAAFWILTDKFKEPTIVDQLSGGIYMRPGFGASLQAELFYKTHRNLRYHQINNRMLLTGITNLNYPWFMNNEATASGLELMYRQQAGSMEFIHSYTLSEVTYRNDVINNGEPFNPEWDRRHQYTFSMNAPVGGGFALRGLWMYASGAANVHALSGADDRERLDAYHRLDLGIHYGHRFSGLDLEVNLAAYNVYNRDNTLYRDPVMVIDRSTRVIPVAEFIYLDVFDLGFQPSFEIRLRF